MRMNIVWFKNNLGNIIFIIWMLVVLIFWLKQFMPQIDEVMMFLFSKNV